MCTKKSDQQFYKELYDKYSPFVYRFCRGYLVDLEDTQDCLQNVFLCAWNKLDTLRTHANVGGWFALTAKHMVYHILRKRKREEKVIPLETYLGPIPSSRGDEDVWAIAKEQDIMEQRIEILQNILTEEEMRIFSDYYFDNVSIEELSKKYKVSASTVYVRLHRIKIKVLRHIHDE